MKNWFCFLLACWIPLAQAGISDNDLLPADQAFAFEASSKQDRVHAVWNIADGYYLYKKKIRFTTDTVGIHLGEPILPPGKVKQDEFFGEIETYRNQVRAEIPVTREPGAADTFELKAASQGCADIGVCYPPQTQVAMLDSPAAAQPAAGSALQTLGELGIGSGFGNQQELLTADQAFRPDVQLTDAGTVLAKWTIAEGYYLYRHRFEFAIDPVPGATLLPVEMPEGEAKTDEFFGEIQVYHLETQANLSFQRNSPDATPIRLTVKYQGCAELGVCYPPVSKQFDLLLPAVGEATAAAAVSTPPSGGTTVVSATPPLSEQDAIAQRLGEGNMLAVLLAFFGFGLLLAFTPCVFPMVPILSSIIVGQGPHITVHRSFVLSLVYVLAMAVTYTIAGVVAGLFGENLQAAFQNPWILSSFAGVFVILSFAMFGLYELQMPAFIQGRLTEISNRQEGGRLVGVAIMGFLSALIVGPCVAAPLAGALIYIGKTGDAVLGGLALFSLSMGMGAPLIAVGIGAGKLLPRAGSWMDQVKAVFGVLMLAVAIWLLERILPAPVTLALWATLLILSSIYLGALDSLQVEASGWSRLAKGVGIVSLVYGILLLVGAASGGKDPLQPLQGVMAGQGGGTHAVEQAHLPFVAIKSTADLDRELAKAAQQGKPVMVDFYADWCVSCKEMEKYTFANSGVQAALSHMILLQADVTANDEADKALLKRFNLVGPPSILFFDQSGTQRTELSLVGYKPADEFIIHVQGLQ